MIYSVSILRRAQKELADISEPFYGRIKDAILKLGENPRPSNCKKLVGRDGWRIKLGDYRIIYEISDSDGEITILHIGHRRGIYS